MQTKENILKEVRTIIKQTIIEDYNKKIILSIISEKENNENFFLKILLESSKETNLDINEILNRKKILLTENKQLLNEVVGTLIISTALASGKLLDLIGVMFKKVRNWLIQKKILKGTQWDKTQLEKFGEFLHKWIIMGFFKILATAILGVIGGFVTTFGIFVSPKIGDITSKIINQKNIDTLANTLFYCCVIIFATLGIAGIAEAVTKGHEIFMPIYEAITTGTKFYEILWLILAFFIITFIPEFNKFKGNLKHFAHTIVDCTEDSGNAWKTIIALSKKLKSGDKKTIQCILQKMNIHTEQPNEQQIQNNITT